MAMENNILEKIWTPKAQAVNRKIGQRFRYSFAGMRLGVTLITPTVEVHKIQLMEELLDFLAMKISHGHLTHVYISQLVFGFLPFEEHFLPNLSWSMPWVQSLQDEAEATAEALALTRRFRSREHRLHR